MAVTPKTYSSIFSAGLKAALANANIQNYKLRFTTDTGELFLDYGNSRIPIREDIIYGMTDTQINAIQSPSSKLYFSSDTHLLYYYDTTLSEWSYVGIEAERAAGLSVVNGQLCVTYQVEVDDPDPEDPEESGDPDPEEEQT